MRVAERHIPLRPPMGNAAPAKTVNTIRGFCARLFYSVCALRCRTALRGVKTQSKRRTATPTPIANAAPDFAMNSFLYCSSCGRTYQSMIGSVPWAMPTSALGQKRTFEAAPANGCFGPEADKARALNALVEFAFSVYPKSWHPPHQPP